MEFDVIVVGGGPGGYVAAIRAAQLGLKTACVEKDKTLGGTCLNVGCIPSKALLHASELYHLSKEKFAGFGIDVPEVKLNLPNMMKQKEQTVEGLTSGIAGLFKKNGVTHLNGFGRLIGGGKVEVKSDSETQVVQGRNIILATGSVPMDLPFLKADENRVVSSTGALAFDKVPEHLVVIGGGVIGLELGSVWLRLGAQVTVVEFFDRLTPTMDAQISRELKKLLGRQGMKFHLGTGVTGAKVKKDGVVLTAKDKKGKEITFEADKVLLSIGRRPFSEGLGLDSAGVKLDNKARVEIDDHFRTSAEGVYAIGDLVRGPMLAHKAEDEGIAVAEIIAGKAGHVNYEVIPNVIYTWPEVASVGKSEEELKEAGVAYNAGTFSVKANSRGRCVNDNDGFVKVLADKETDRILGVHMVAPHASEMIAEVVVAMEYMASAEDLARIVHAHPTFSESIKEAAMSVDNRAIHA